MKSLLIYSDDKLFLKLPTHQAISRSAENNVHPRHSGHSAIPSRMDLFWVSVCSWCPFIRVQPISIQTFLYYNWKTIFFKSKTGNKMQNNCRNPESFPGFPFCTNSPALIFPRKRPGPSRMWYPVFHAAFPDFWTCILMRKCSKQAISILLYYMKKVGFGNAQIRLRLYIIPGFSCFLPRRADVFPRFRRALPAVRVKVFPE